MDHVNEQAKIGVGDVQLNEGAAELAQQEAELVEAEQKNSRLMRKLIVG